MAKKLIRKDGEEVVVDRAVKDGNGNVITSTYVGKVGDQEISGGLSVEDTLNVIGTSATAVIGQGPNSGLRVETTPGNYPSLVLCKGTGEGGTQLAGKTTLTQSTQVGTSVSLTLPSSSGTIALKTDIPAPVDAYTKAESDGRYLQLNPASPQTVKADVTFADDTAGGNNSSITIRTNEGFPIITGTALGVGDSQFLTALVLHGAGTLTENVTIQTPLQSGTIALTSDIPDVSGLATKAEVEAKQDELTSTQLSAVNSGITSAKVGTYDGYATQISGKQSDLGLAWEDYA